MTFRILKENPDYTGVLRGAFFVRTFKYSVFLRFSRFFKDCRAVFLMIYSDDNLQNVEIYS